MNKSKRLNKTQFGIQSNQCIYYQIFNRLKQKKPFYSFLVVSCLHCCVWLSLVAVSGDYSLIIVHRLLIAVASLVAEHRLLGVRAPVVAAHRLSCSLACRIFPDIGLNPCPLHWQLDSQSLDPQASPLYQTSEIQLCKTQS